MDDAQHHRAAEHAIGTCENRDKERRGSGERSDGNRQDPSNRAQIRARRTW